MNLTINKFNAPKGKEKIFGNNPYNFLAVYESDFGKEYGAIQYKLLITHDSEEVVLDEGVKFISGNGEIEVFDTLCDVGSAVRGDNVILKYRLFTLESTEGPQLELISFTADVPSKGAADLELSAPANGIIEMQPGGFAKCNIKITANSESEWFAVAVIYDQLGSSSVEGVLADNGIAKVAVGLAGKPKVITGELMTLGPNQWVEIDTVLP